MDASGLYVYRNAHTLRKYDRDGTLLWSADLGSAIEPGWIGGVGSMVASPSGGVYIGATECQPSADGWCHPPRVDYQVTRVDANGNVLWSTHLPASTRGEFWPFLVPSGDGVVALTSSLACGHAEAQRWERTCMTRLDQLGHRTDHAILRPTDLTWQDPHGSMPGFALPFQDDGVLIGRSAGPGSFELLNYDRTGTLVSSRLVHLGSGSYWPAAAATEGQGLAIAAISWHGGDREIPIVASLPEGAAAP